MANQIVCSIVLNVNIYHSIQYVYISTILFPNENNYITIKYVNYYII